MGLLWLSTVPLTMGLVTVMFGTRYMATLFGFVFLSHQVGSFFGVWMGRRLYDQFGSYNAVWWMSAALGIFAALIHLPIREQRSHRFVQPPGMTETWPGHRFAAAFGGLVVIVWLIVMAVTMRKAALPPEAPGPLLAVFEPGMSEDGMLARIIAANGKPLRGTWLGFVWVVAGEEAGLAGRLEEQGAIGSYAELPFDPTLAGCFAYADAKVAGAFSIKP